MSKLISMSYNYNGIKESIIEMSSLASKLMVVLISLPPHFEQIKESYNTQKDKWSLNELILKASIAKWTLSIFSFFSFSSSCIKGDISSSRDYLSIDLSVVTNFELPKVYWESDQNQVQNQILMKL
jgi:hypothetical protein